MIYINGKFGFGIETVDEFETRAEALKMLIEYRISDTENSYWVSTRSTKDWRER